MPPTVNERPNILLVMTDQQRGDCVAADPVAPAPLQTPNLDSLARSGAHFLHAYAESPSCIPARRSLMSGTAPAANGAVGFRGGIEWNPPATLAGELSRAGYQTEMIGKLHLHPDRRRYGFDHMQLANSTRGGDNEYVQWLRDIHGRREVDPGMAHGVSSNGWVGRPPSPARGADAHLLGRGPGHGVPPAPRPERPLLPQPLLHRSPSAPDAAPVLLRPLHRPRPAAPRRGRLGRRPGRAPAGAEHRRLAHPISTRTRCAAPGPPTTG